MKRNLEKIGFFLVAISGFFTPNSVTLMSIFLLLSFIIGIFLIDKEYIKKLKKNVFILPVLLLFLYLIFHIFISKNKIVAIKYTRGWWTILSLFIIPLFVKDVKKRNFVILLYIIGVFLAIVWGFYKYFTYYINLEKERLKGFGIGFLPFALFLGYGIIIFTYFLTKRKNYLFLIPIALSSLVITFTISIGPFISLFPALLVFLIGERKKERMIQIIICYLIFFLSSFSAPPYVEKLVSYFQAKPEKITNASIRQLYWRYSIYCFKSSPIIGKRTGDFWTYGDEFIPVSRLNQKEKFILLKDLNKNFHSHNMFIDMLGRTGIIGFILLIFFISTFLYYGIKIFLKDKDTGLLLLSLLSYIIFYSITEDPFFRSDMAFPLYYFFASHLNYDYNKE
uniref:O-antigen ligase-related domain-containing protein n=1 Tax=candidate division WOR-3 bacterium TaxID=2052148 RepID=A0A7C4UBT8_UNCW3